jgi:hypothetical protein
MDEDEEEVPFTEPQQWWFGGEVNEFILDEEAVLPAGHPFGHHLSILQLKTQFGAQERN